MESRFLPPNDARETRASGHAGALQLPAELCEFSGSWKAELARVVSAAETDLGLAPGSLRPELYKLLVYQTGGFFLPHRDSEKTPGMVSPRTHVERFIEAVPLDLDYRTIAVGSPHRLVVTKNRATFESLHSRYKLEKVLLGELKRR